MSIAAQIARIQDNISAALAAVNEKGAPVPENAASDQLASLIASIPEGVFLPGFMHRLEFHTVALPNGGATMETPYFIGENYNAEIPGFVLGWTDDPVSGVNQVVQFVYWNEFESPYQKVSYVYANGYTNFTSYARTVYVADLTGNDYASIKLYTPADIATGEKPTTAFSFAPGARYNLVMGRMKDKYNK